MAELTIFKETFEKIIDEFWEGHPDSWYLRQWFITGICLSIVMIPFVLVNKIQKLKYLALIGVGAISCYVVSLIINFIKLTVIDGELGPNIRAFPEDGVAAISSIPNILLAFLYQMNFFPIYKGMEGSNDNKMLNASLIATICSFVVYTTTGVLGYLTYGSLIKGSNFLSVLQKEDTGIPLYIIMNSVFLISVLCSFPLMFFGARNNFIALIKVFKTNNSKPKSELRPQDSIADISDYIISGSGEKKKKQAKIVFYVMTFVLFVIIMAIAVSVG